MMKSKTSTPTPSNRVLAIDPGFDRIGVAVMEKVESKEHILFSDCIATDRLLTQEKRLEQIGIAVRKIIENYSPSMLALEKLFFNQNITTALRVAEARGVILYEAAQHEIEIFEYSPQSIKLAVTGYGKAGKREIALMVKRLTGLVPRSKHDDELDAVAVGITHLALIKHIWYK